MQPCSCTMAVPVDHSARSASIGSSFDACPDTADDRHLETNFRRISPFCIPILRRMPISRIRSGPLITYPYRRVYMHKMEAKEPMEPQGCTMVTSGWETRHGER